MDDPIHVFQSLARLSGAEVAYPVSAHALERAINRIRNTLTAQYVLSYYLKPEVRGYRRIEVKVKRFGVRVRARPGLEVLSSGNPGPAPGSGCIVTAKSNPYPYETRISSGPRGLRMYRDDFSDPASGWPNREFFHYGAAGYHILRSYSLDRTVIAYGPWWEDFRASVTVSFVGESSENAAAGLAFRVNDVRHSTLGNNSGLYSLLLSSSGRKIQLLNLGRPKSGELFSATVEANVLNRLGVECIGGEVRVLLNGSTIGVVHHYARTSGMVGLQLTGAGHAVFSELVVEDLAAGH